MTVSSIAVPVLGLVLGGGAAYGLSRIGIEVPALEPEDPAWQVAATHFTLFGIHTLLGAVLGLAVGVLAGELWRRKSD